MLARATRTARYGMMADVLINVKPGKAPDLLSAVPQLEGVRHADTRRGVPDIFVEAEAADAKGLKLLTSSDSAVRARGAYRNSHRRGVRRTELIRERIRSRTPLLLTVTADVRQGTAFNRASGMGRAQASHTPKVPCAIRANASSIARNRWVSLWRKWVWSVVWASSVARSVGSPGRPSALPASAKVPTRLGNNSRCLASKNCLY